ncbi:MAG: ABC-2 transporter permease [Methanocorpusculum sp.]|nr:ABC-2 transporter permease [Oscillospiraceae bacterium]MBQ3569691.1 ABC-2 transporter permease [Methanocorpusculum sp.]
MNSGKTVYKGLIYKDLFLLKEAFPIVALAVLFLLFSITLGFTGGFLALCIMLLVFAVKVVESTLIYDETDGWDSFVLTAPVSRKEVIRSKYLLQILFLAGAFLISAVILLLISLIPQFDGEEWLYIMLIVGFCYALVYGAVVIPVYLKFGQHTSRYVAFVILIVVAGLFGVTFGFSMFMEFAASTIPLLIGILAVSLAAYGASYRISQRIYAKREF